VPIGTGERAFFVQLGAQFVSLRNEQGITQVQVTELFKVSQQTINAYEVGRQRMPVSSLRGHRTLPWGLHRRADRGAAECGGQEARTDAEDPPADGAHPALTEGPAALRHAGDRYRSRPAGPLKSAAKKGDHDG
jgi:transcriptional regulator with XRE-family HTH domain